jgi:predicted Zn-dependent protease
VKYHYEDVVTARLRRLEAYYDRGSLSIITRELPSLRARRVFEDGVWTIYMDSPPRRRSRRRDGRQGLSEASLYTGSYSVGVESVGADDVAKVVEDVAALVEAHGCEASIAASYTVVEKSIAHPDGVASEARGIAVLDITAYCPEARASLHVSEQGIRSLQDPRVVRLLAAEVVGTAKHHGRAARLNPLASGRWVVLLRREASVALAEALAGMLLGDAPALYLGETVGSSYITLVDDPFNPLGVGYRLFDDEAVRVKRRKLVEDGKVVDYLHTRQTAVRTGSEPGSAVGLFEPPRPFHGSLILRPGDWKEEEILEETRKAILVDSVSTWWVEGKIVTLAPSRAWIVERGELKPVKLSRIRIRIPNETLTVDAVSRSLWPTLRLRGYTVVGAAAPTVRLVGYVD